MNTVHYSIKREDWATPRDLFKAIERKLGPFTLDVCASQANAKCSRFFTKSQDGLTQTWEGRCWMNPPYGRQIGLWMKKARDESARFNGPVVVCLVPARTDSAWWHNYAALGQVYFLRGRVTFEGGKFTAPFPSAVVVFDSNKEPATYYGLA